MSSKSNDESKDNSNGRNVPKNIDKLLKKEKRRNIEDDERDELFKWLQNIDDIQGLVKSEPYNFTDQDYSRMMKAKVRHGSRQKAGKAIKDPAGVLRKKESDDFDEFITGLWSQARDIGTNVIQKYASRASELGYYDEDLGMVDMREFTEDALEFYIAERPKVRQRKQWLAAYRAAFNVSNLYIRNQKQMLQKMARFIMEKGEEYDMTAEELAPLRGILNQLVGGENVAK